MNRTKFRKAIQAIYAAVIKLEVAFPRRRFTPDGHMVGSIGEAIASAHLGAKLYLPNTPRVDGEWHGKPVQIKATQGKDTYLKKPNVGDLLLVIKIHKSGDHDVVYFNDAMRVWRSRDDVKETRSGEKFVSFVQLRALGLPILQK